MSYLTRLGGLLCEHMPSWCAALGALLVALPTPTGGVRTANEVVHFAISHQDCTFICSDDAVCEVDGMSKFTEQVNHPRRVALCGSTVRAYPPTVLYVLRATRRRVRCGTHHTFLVRAAAFSLCTHRWLKAMP